MKLAKGSKISCPKCNLPQLISTNDLNHGEQMKNGGWSTLGYDMDSLFMTCYACGTYWAKFTEDLATEIHFEEKGWVPLKATGLIHVVS